MDLYRKDWEVLADRGDVISAVAYGWVHIIVVALLRRTAANRCSCAKVEPSDDFLHQRVAQAGVLDPFDGLADEGLDQQRLAPASRGMPRALR